MTSRSAARLMASGRRDGRGRPATDAPRPSSATVDGGLLRLAAYYLLEIRERVFGKDNVCWEAQGQLTIGVDECFDEGVAWRYFDSLPVDKYKLGLSAAR